MEKGYYKPEIEEFCIGFEFENFADEYDDRWCELIIEENDTFDNINYGLKEDLIRVKLLDLSDIKAEGFNPHLDGYLKITEGRYNCQLWHFPDTSLVVIRCGADTIFRGTIKNKTEFKKLLKQLGI